MQLHVTAILLLGASLCTAQDQDAYVTKYICENQSMNLTCPEGQMLNIKLANYGRFSLGICNEEGKSWGNTQCMFVGTLKTVSELCGGRSKCELHADNDHFIDTCPKISKYLQVQFNCLTAPITTAPPQTTPDLTEDDILTTSKPRLVKTPAPTTARPVTTTPTAVCKPTSRRGIIWPATTVGFSAKERCPKNPRSFAQWNCSKSGRWFPTHPDLSRCVAHWASDIATASANLTNVAAATSLGEQITERSADPDLTGGDTRTLAEALLRIGRSGRAALAKSPKEDRAAAADKLGSVVIEAADRLLSPEVEKTWHDLPRDQATRAAASVLESVEVSGSVVAENIGSAPLVRNSVSVVLEVSRVSTPTTYVRLPTQPETRSAASVRLPRAAFPASQEQTSVIFSSIEGLGAHMQPPPKVLGEKTKQREVSSEIVTAVISGRAEVANLPEPVIITLGLRETAGRSSPACAWWASGVSSGEWRESGCRLVDSNATHGVCHCDHLTSFAILMDLDGDDYGGVHHIMMSFITYTGCVFSIVCLSICVVTFALMLRGSGNIDRLVIHMNLCVCLALAELVFLFGIGQTGSAVACSVVAGALHYLFLCAFSWMLLEGVQLYALLIEVFEAAHSRKAAFFLFGYGFPALVVGITVGVDRGANYGTANFCWLRPDNFFILTFIVPVALILACNLVFLLMALGIMCRHTSFSSSGYRHCQHRTPIQNIGSWVRGAVILVVLLGLTWGLGLVHLAFPSRPLEYAFTALNASQGVAIFVFHVLLNDKVKYDPVPRKSAQKEYQGWIRRNSWLPDCIRGPVLDGFYSPASPKPNSTPTPVPLSTSTSANGSYLTKYLSTTTAAVPTSEVSAGSAQALLTHHAFFDPRNFQTDDKYGYSYAQDWSESSQSTQATEESEGHIYADPQEARPTPPPPSFPPPPPPYYDVRPATLDRRSLQPAVYAPLYAAGVGPNRLLLVGQPSLDTDFDGPPSEANFRLPVGSSATLHNPRRGGDSAYSASSLASSSLRHSGGASFAGSSSPESGVPSYETPRSSIASPQLSPARPELPKPRKPVPRARLGR